VSYEFSDDENRVFSRLAATGRAAAILNFVVAAIVVAGVRWFAFSPSTRVTIDGAVILGACSLNVVFGVWKLKAAAQFRLIVTTRGSDIPLLMSGFVELAKIYRTQWMIMGIAILLSLAMVGLAVILAVV
jgi:hypothetical protein